MWTLVIAPSPCLPLVSLLGGARSLKEAVDFVRMRLGSFADLAFRLQAARDHFTWAWNSGGIDSSRGIARVARRGDCVCLPFSRTVA